VHSQLPHARGERVHVRLDPDGCLAYNTTSSTVRDSPDLTAVSIDVVGRQPQLAASAPSRRNL